jgi:uncharacterized flavoprotein (TIGR03862 family)
VVIGGGPAGLMAAQTLISQGVPVAVFDAMPSVGRKFLLAGRGGLNLTHSEPLAAFIARYGSSQNRVSAWLDRFSPVDLRAWAHSLGQPTFVGSSGRVFPVGMKAAPLLRSWLHGLRQAGVIFYMRHRWAGWPSVPSKQLQFVTQHGSVNVHADVVVLALGGGSWPQLGSDGAWVASLVQQGVNVTALAPSNCGFDAPWSEYFKTRYAGHPLKSVAIELQGIEQLGECVVTQYGLEGSLIYALSSVLRQTIEREGQVSLSMDLLPMRSLDSVRSELCRPRGSRSLSTHLKARLGLHGVKAGLLYECAPQLLSRTEPDQWAQLIKHLPITLLRPQPLAQAISSAGGVCLSEFDAGLMLKRLPGVYCVGEMLDWEAPTGGYLLNACMASGRIAGLAAAQHWFNQGSAH